MERGINIVIRDDKDRVLVLKRSPEAKISPSLWNLPGGSVERREKLNKAVVREAREETSLEIEPENKPFYIYYYPKTAVYAVKARIVKGNVILNKEHTKFKWVSKDDWKNLKYTPSGLATLKKFFK